MLILLTSARRMIALAAVLLLLISYADPLVSMSEQLDVDLSGGTVITQWDTHGGFHGDGTTYREVFFPDGLSQVFYSPAWLPLPLSSNLKELTSRLRGPEGAPLFPDISNGYYCFVDRFDTATDPKDDTNVLNRHSFNYTLAIYDTDTNTLFYVAEDT